MAQAVQLQWDGSSGTRETGTMSHRYQAGPQCHKYLCRAASGHVRSNQYVLLPVPGKEAHRGSVCDSCLRVTWSDPSVPLRAARRPHGSAGAGHSYSMTGM